MTASLSGPSNRVNFDPSLADLLNLLRKDIFLSFNCHAIATVQSFDSTNQSVTATINYQKVYQEADAVTGLYSQKPISYPIVIDCPVIVMKGGLAALTFPIAQGDSCLLLFNDRDIDGWIATGGVAAPQSQRLHAFNDAIALVGLSPFSAPILAYDTDRAVLSNDQAKVAVGPSLIEISNNVTDLKTCLNDLITALTTLTTAMSSATPSTVVAAIATPSGAATTALNLVKTTIGDLLQ